MNSENHQPSNRAFGVLMASAFALFSAYAACCSGSGVAIIGCMLAAIVIGLVTLIKPTVLTPFNKAWMRLGDLMGRVVSPLVLGSIFFVLITPIALATRFLGGRDELRLRRRNVTSYWLDRDPPGPTGASFKNQF